MVALPVREYGLLLKHEGVHLFCNSLVLDSNFLRKNDSLLLVREQGNHIQNSRLQTNSILIIILLY